MENATTQQGSLGNTNDGTLVDPAALKSTKTLEELGLDLASDETNFVSQSLAVQSFSSYLTDPDTDTENSVLRPNRRWVWYCKLRDCPGYYSAWTCKTNFLLHLYETPVHQEDASTKTREGRCRLASSWREETAYDLSEPKKMPPQDGETGRKGRNESATS
ncbi:MAG: hypothetical protein M1816_002378 [Peltula sp. TS41687]|nr:MAG: hypothetical protein M1816_002378 [Peltula sp. TS41687]